MSLSPTSFNWHHWLELTKPRLSFLSVLTAVIGYVVVVTGDHFSILTLLILAIGTALAAGGAATLNQVLEHREDKKMKRTQNRPIPSGQLELGPALYFGIAISIIGSLFVFLGIHALAGLLTFATVLLYIFLYTPLKKITPYNTEIGAIPGALPPLIGYVSATGTIDAMGWILFALLFCWQMPHFMAIAWMYRQDYAQAGFKMLSFYDAEGKRVALRSLVYTLLLFGVTLLPWFFYNASMTYGLLALGLNIYFLYQAVQFFQHNERDETARKLFFTSIFYLPTILFLLVIDHLLLS